GGPRDRVAIRQLPRLTRVATGSATRARRSDRVKDGRAENTHPLNRGSYQDRIPLFEAFLGFAEALARCSPARSHRTGCVLVSHNLERVLGAGFSGGAVGARGGARARGR